MNETSVLELISRLCNLHIGPAQRAYRQQPTISRSDSKKRLKILAFNALFSYLFDKKVDDKTVCDHEVETILLEFYKLRLQRKYDEADRLESLFNQLQLEDNTEIRHVLRFLIALKDTNDSPQTQEAGFHFPKTKKEKNVEHYFSQPLCYGDLKMSLSSGHYYLHYPREVFEKPFPTVMMTNEKQIYSAFDSLPGQGLGPDCLFTTKFLLDDCHEHITHNSLFGGLMQGRVTDLNMLLQLPDLSLDPQIRIPELQPRKSSSLTEMSEESGLGSGSASMSSSVLTMEGHSGYDDSIWEKALTDPRSNHYTWEWIGYQPGKTEKPFLTEAGPAAFDVLIRLKLRVSTILCPDTDVVPLVTVQPDKLVQHILLMLIGVPSNSFSFNHSTSCFDVVDGLHVSGISPEMLKNFLTEFLHCGTFYVRLTHFSQPPVLNSFYTGGLIFQAFTGAIRKVLNHYTAAILSIAHDIQLLQLKVHMYKAMQQIRYLAELCQCHDKPPPHVAPGNFPTGMKLLSYLYAEAAVSSSSPHYSMLLSILQTSWTPFMLFIRNWVFHGVHRDYYEEFMIQIDLSCLEARDETYWTRAYSLSPNYVEDGIPEFLREIINDIVTCGKSINLLRICSPQHFMCNVTESDIPPVTITFSQKDLKITERYCQVYVARMRQIARQITVDRQEILERIEREKLELQQTARQMAENEIKRLQGQIDERRRRVKAKQRVELDRLKQQMETDIQRRSDEKKDEKERDKQYMAQLNREEEALSQQEVELEKKAREELVAYYTELGEEAMHRERVALWKVRRHQLGYARYLFLKADAERWRKEYQDHLGEDVVDAVLSPTLPSWAMRSADGTIEVTDEGEVTLPTWALRDNYTLVRGDSYSPDIISSLPNWAKRTVYPENFHPMFITEDHGSDEDNVPEAQFDPAEQGTDNLRGGDAGLAVTSQTSAEESIQKSKVTSHPSRESEEEPAVQHTHQVEGKHVTEETVASEDSKPSIKMVEGANILQESQPARTVQHIKTSSTMSASRQSQPAALKPHLKFSAGKQVNQESVGERAMIPRKQRSSSGQGVSSETESKLWGIKKASVFGHVSQLSNANYVVTIPKLRRQNQRHANMESDYKEFLIKPGVRMNKAMSASQESQAVSGDQRSHIRTYAHRNASTESQQVDENVVRRQKFLARNASGHSSDSTVQKLLYPEARRLNTVQEDVVDGELGGITLQAGLPYQLENYQTEYTRLDEAPCVDLMSGIVVIDLGSYLVSPVATSEDEVEAYKNTPLPVLLTRSIAAPIRAQISLVNTSIINYFTSELKVDQHFEAIRRYLLMADGDFAEILANILLEKLSTNPLPQEILNPVFLNGALTKAIRSSIHSDDEYTKHLSFALKFMPSVLMPNAPNSLRCLELRYNVTWPLCVILSSSCMEKYYCVFDFLLQIKRVVWVLKDVWHRLKRDALIHKAGSTSQFRHLQLHRQEMEHFVKMMQGYITCKSCVNCFSQEMEHFVKMMLHHM
ncbi:gamma-tubulin complex component 6-like isoform X3 [Physella acuta]|uniref:gamma-tubulin complex component 6-like isoform X2 n=1 Tax=Physella acuta TaxID=109671 RepID=UPI0027DB042E|nr:gamma-tubulin complex component 6-like isoform X2 [Physella acuta]XP_059159864.1 gamma-tubulin complex component 6-like isoform X3 [Physella acuta]